MKIEFTPNNDVPPIKFPKLYRGTCCTVLFFNERNGVVIDITKFNHTDKPGDFIQDWTPCTETAIWTPLEPGNKVAFTQE